MRLPFPCWSSVVRVLACGGAACALAGCKVGPDYVPPAQNAPQTFTHLGSEGFAANSLTTAAKPIEAAWWRTLGDPTLDTLVDEAVAGNLDLKTAEARIREARFERGVAASEFFPTVDASASYTRQRLSQRVYTYTGVPPFNLFDGQFDANWEIDVFGRVQRNVEAAEADIETTVEDKRSILVTLLAEVARNYTELRGFERRLEIAAKNIKLQQDTVDLTQGRFAAGLTNEVDVAQARAVLAQTQSVVPNLDQAAQAAIHRIGVLLGREPTALIGELTTSISVPQVPDEIPVGLPSELLRRRPDIRRAERQMAAASARIGVATADLFPRFSLTGTFGLQSNKVASFGDAGARFWSFGPAVRWPIFEGGRIRANIGVQNARFDQAVSQYGQTVLTTFEEVENALVAYSREQARRKSLVEAVEANRRAFTLSTDLYSNGLTDFLRVIDTQRQLFSAEDSLVESDTTVTANLVQLYKALGGGWEHVEAKQAPADAQPE